MTDTTAAAAPLPAAYKEPVPVGGPIAALVPQNLEQAFRLSQALSQAGDMIPEVYRGNPQMIMAAIMKGLEVGLAPMQALSSIAVIGGRPSVWGDAIPALIQRAGHDIDCEVTGEGDARVATATLERSNGKKYVRTFSVADAKLAKLWGKKTKSGGDTPWSTHPDRMLMMRARTFAARDGAADALMGLQVAEEVQDYGPDNARDVTPAAESAPRRGGVMYREAPEPRRLVDEIEEHHPVADEAAEVLEAAQPVAIDHDRLALAIRAEMGHAEPADIIATYADALREMRIARPDLAAALEAELGGASVMDIKVVMVARDASIAELVERCARKEIPFSGPGSLCAELSRRGYSFNGAYEAVLAAEAELAGRPA